ncbi:AAA family ATPase [Polynucleobacter brandtiae]|uniref:Cobaltochelatase CobS subunit n=1 Tax=Polynucleobacter brandtiae TaxID=1938816 RepID=A0A2M8VZ41_9BURK|nr:MoxR family ATPase [Polynucleobacter brandtiae]PJI83123.1 cobaltochelatase CobS subunit [Polynucleobacter brandtiae]
MTESPSSHNLTHAQPDLLVGLHTIFPECKSYADFQIPVFSQLSDLVPPVDPAYQLNPEATLAILAGFAFNRRVMLQGMHGTGKSTHIEQVAARLNWPCLRINLDGQITRMDLIGKDTIILADGKQITRFQEGLIPWSLQRPIALILDEYDAGQPDVMFVIQRMLEREGKLTLLDQNRVIEPHPAFRIFATSNTVGLGNWNGLYQGTQLLNHGQMDRWDIVAALNYLAPQEEQKILLSKVPELSPEQSEQMIALANLTRAGFEAGDLSTLMSTRTLITWGENWRIFKDFHLAFALAFLNKCEAEEKILIAEYFQRCFAVELHPDTTLNQ